MTGAGGRMGASRNFEACARGSGFDSQTSSQTQSQPPTVDLSEPQDRGRVRAQASTIDNASGPLELVSVESAAASNQRRISVESASNQRCDVLRLTARGLLGFVCGGRAEAGGGGGGGSRVQGGSARVDRARGAKGAGGGGGRGGGGRRGPESARPERPSLSLEASGRSARGDSLRPLGSSRSSSALSRSPVVSVGGVTVGCGGTGLRECEAQPGARGSCGDAAEAGRPERAEALKGP
eukprot:1290539-Rhodomonas_salina.6